MDLKFQTQIMFIKFVGIEYDEECMTQNSFMTTTC